MIRIARFAGFFAAAAIAGAGLLAATQTSTATDDKAAPGRATTGPLSGDGAPARLGIAKFDSTGDLIRPVDVDEWVFMGASLGMGYNEQDFDPEDAGMFQIVTMEPAAFAHFMKTGDYADGTMFALKFYGSNARLSSNRSGFVIGDLHGMELHMLDSTRFKDGHNFYGFSGGNATATVMPDGNGCVTCHNQNAAFKATFAQFYPAIRGHLPAGVLDASLARGTERPE